MKEFCAQWCALDELERVDVGEEEQVFPGCHAGQSGVVPVVNGWDGLAEDKCRERCALQQVASFGEAMADFEVVDGAMVQC